MNRETTKPGRTVGIQRLGGLLLVAAIAAMVSVGCGGASSHGGVSAEEDTFGPGALLPPDAMGFDFSWRQRVSIAWREPDGTTRTESFDAVLQARDGQLQLVGLGPMERPAFGITQSDSGVTIENLSDRALPFDAAYMIADVQRVYFPWSDVFPAFGTGERTVDGEDVFVTERWESGELVERRFVRRGAQERGEVVVRYEGWTDGDAPRKATLESGWFGYELTVETVQQQRL